MELTKNNQITGYSVHTPIYEGPLDLLLQLIENAKLDITLLSLSHVTDQYLEYIKNLQVLEIQGISEFLVVAAKLIQIKSEYLLPKPQIISEEPEYEGHDLAQQLILYKKFKEAALFLQTREENNLRTYLRVANLPAIKPKLENDEYMISDLVIAAETILNKVDHRPEITTVVTLPKITIHDKLSRIASFLKRNKKGSFRSILEKKPTRIDIVVTFLAMLELIKRHLILISQDELFGEIYIQPAEQWAQEDVYSITTEFDE